MDFCDHYMNKEDNNKHDEDDSSMNINSLGSPSIQWVSQTREEIRVEQVAEDMEQERSVEVHEHANREPENQKKEGYNFEDPLLLDILDRPLNRRDPPSQQQEVGETSIGMSSKKPRGRPKKGALNHSVQQCRISPSLSSSEEAETTWRTAQLLGISCNDEGAVIEGIRKSKRLLLMEGRSH